VPSVGRPPAAAARPAAKATPARPAAKAARPAGRPASKKTAKSGKQHKAKLVKAQQKHLKSITLMQTMIPVTLVVGLLLIAFLVVAFSIEPPKAMTELQEDMDTRMDMPVPTLFSQPWLRPVAMAACLPMALGLFGLMIFMMVQTNSQNQKVRQLQQEIDALAHHGG
jgi:cell division protein FtsL